MGREEEGIEMYNKEYCWTELELTLAEHEEICPKGHALPEQYRYIIKTVIYPSQYIKTGTWSSLHMME